MHVAILPVNLDGAMASLLLWRSIQHCSSPCKFYPHDPSDELLLLEAVVEWLRLPVSCPRIRCKWPYSYA